MFLANLRKRTITKQYLISLALIMVTSISCYFSVDFIGYRVVALLLLLVVSFLAMIFDILPVLITAVSSALIWNFFFIPPTFNLFISTTEDLLMFLMYFVVALINTVLTFKIRNAEKKARDKEKREKTIQLYNTMLNSLSHELRTPISAIIGAVDTIKENNTKLTDDNKKELISEIEIAGLRLNRQVENLLNMSRLEAGALNLNPDWRDVNELVYSILKNIEPDSDSHIIRFNVNENLPLFRLDRILTEQILHNIIHNAIQYTPPGSTILISVHKINELCCITIADNGNGFPKNEIQAAFDKFYRVHTMSSGGTGLGLSIAKGFTEVMNGEISLENLETGGAKFTIEIPAPSSEILELRNEQG